MRKDIPFKKALIWILLVTLAISGSALFLILCYFQVIDLRKSHPGFNIVSIERTDDRLPVDYLAFLLHLSADRPLNLYRLDIAGARKRLLSSGIIAECTISRVPPNVLRIDYKLREPLAKVAYFANTAVDESGVFFPLAPFFKDSELPEIVLGPGEETIHWGERVSNEKMRTILDLFDILRNMGQITRIDLSKAEVESLGQREIVAILKNSNFFYFLRLPPDNYCPQLNNFVRLREHQKADSRHQIVDLRITDLAFLTSFYPQERGGDQ